MPVSPSHASSDIVILITYLHNGINTPSLSHRNILAPLYSDFLGIFPLDTFFVQTSRQASPSFSGRDIAKGSRTRFYISLFLGRKSVFLQLRTLSLKRLMPSRILNNFSDTQQFLVKFCSQRTAAQRTEGVSIPTHNISWYLLDQDWIPDQRSLNININQWMGSGC